MEHLGTEIDAWLDQQNLERLPEDEIRAPKDHLGPDEVSDTESEPEQAPIHVVLVKTTGETEVLFQSDFIEPVRGAGGGYYTPVAVAPGVLMWLDDEGMQLEDERGTEPQQPAAHRHSARTASTTCCGRATRTSQTKAQR